MKRYLRVCAALLCALLMISVFPAARAAGPVYFTAVNETVLKLEDATMPFRSNGKLYIASDLFADKELGITYYHNALTKVATLYDNNKALQFDMEKGIVVDGQGARVSFGAVMRNGRLFFPIDGVARYFNITYSETKVSRGYVVRLRSQDSVLNDRLFLDAATSLLEYRYEEYEKALEAAKPPVQDPPVPPDPPPGPVTPPEPDKRTVYMGIRAAENSGELLDVLLAAEATATFFFSEDQMVSNAAFLRRLVVSGYGIGLIADEGGERAVSEQLKAANGILWRLTGTKTRLCVLENAGDSDRKTASDAGYCCLKAGVDRTGRELTEGDAAELYRVIHQKTGDDVTVWLGAGVSPVGLDAFLKLAKHNGDRLAALTETVMDH